MSQHGKKLSNSRIAMIVGGMTLALLIAALVINWMPTQASTFAHDVDWLHYFIYYVSVFFTLLIAGTLVFFLLYYKQTDKAAIAPGKATHSTALELTWTIIPIFIVLAIFAFGFKGFIHMSVPPAGAYKVVAMAKQWSWGFMYPNGYTDGNLHMVAGQPVEMTLESSDVIHSLYIKQFRAKKDVVPGRYNTMWFESPWSDTIYKNQLDAAQKEDALDVEREAKAKAEYDQLLAAIETAEKHLNEVIASSETSAKQKEQAEKDLANVQAAFDSFRHKNDKGAFKFFRPDRNLRTTDFDHEVMIFDVYCTEYCGKSHSQMNQQVVVHKTQEDFDKWLAYWSDPEKAYPNPVAYGQELWGANCRTCHSLDGSALSGGGPSWKDIWLRESPLVGGGTWKDRYPNFEEYITASIHIPQKDIIGGYQGVNMSAFPGLAQRDLRAIMEFMKSISEKGGTPIGTWEQFNPPAAEGEQPAAE